MDSNGNLFLSDAILALSIVVVAFFIFNTLISLPNPTYSDTSNNFKSAQDVMEVLSGKVDFGDNTFLAEITGILKENKNSVESVRKVSSLCADELDGMKLNNYRFVESNNLNNKVLASHGDYSGANNVSTATRHYDNYSYTLYVW